MALPLPPTYLLQTHLTLDALHELEDQIPSLTYDITEAKLVLGKVTTKQRALFELRSRRLFTEEVLPPQEKELEDGSINGDAQNPGPPQKRRRIDDPEGEDVTLIIRSTTNSEAETESETEYATAPASQQSTQSQDRSSPPPPVSSSPIGPTSPLSVATSVGDQPDDEWGETVKVVKLAWFIESLAAGHLLPFGNYLVYEGRPVEPPETISAEPKIIKVFSKFLQHTWGFLRFICS